MLPNTLLVVILHHSFLFYFFARVIYFHRAVENASYIGTFAVQHIILLVLAPYALFEVVFIFAFFIEGTIFVIEGVLTVFLIVFIIGFLF